MLISHILEELAVNGTGMISKSILKGVLKDNSIWKREKYKELISEHIFNEEKFGPNDILANAADQVEGFTHSIIDQMPDFPEILNIDVDFSFVADSMEEIENVMSNMMGIDLPEGLDLLPGASELILGIRLLLDIKAVNKEFTGMPNDKKKNIMAAKALVTISKFGVTTTLTSVGALAGGAVGAHFAGIGAAITGPAGAIAGGFAARKINKTIAPHAQDIAYQLLDLNKVDIFYFKNKVRIDDIGIGLLNMKKRLTEEFS